MKKCLLFLIIIISTLKVFGVQDTTETTKAKKHKSKQERLVMDLGLDSWMKMPPGINTQWIKSRRFEFYFMRDKAFAHGHLGIAYGLGMSFSNVNSNATYSNNTDTLVPYQGISPSQSKLSTNYLEIPVELRFRTSPLHHGNRLKLDVGVKAGWLMQEHLKFQDGSVKEKFYNDSNVNNFRFAYTARIGYGKFGLMGYYGINALYKNGNGNKIIPFGLGITFTPRAGGMLE